MLFLLRQTEGGTFKPSIDIAEIFQMPSNLSLFVLLPINYFLMGYGLNYRNNPPFLPQGCGILLFDVHILILIHMSCSVDGPWSLHQT